MKKKISIKEKITRLEAIEMCIQHAASQMEAVIEERNRYAELADNTEEDSWYIKMRDEYTIRCKVWEALIDELEALAE